MRSRQLIKAFGGKPDINMNVIELLILRYFEILQLYKIPLTGVEGLLICGCSI